MPTTKKKHVQLEPAAIAATTVERLVGDGPRHRCFIADDNDRHWSLPPRGEEPRELTEIFK